MNSNIMCQLKHSTFSVPRTKQLLIALSLILVSAGCTTWAAHYPKAEIANEWIKAKLYLPNAKTGYYTSTRYDWSGIIYELEYGDHSYTGSWVPDSNEHSFVDKLGPVNVFSPVVQSEDESGSKIIKIGIGLLSIPAGEVYHQKQVFPIEDFGTWEINHEPNSIEFTHKLRAKPYAYEYTKKIALTESTSEMQLIHALKNTGSKTIKTTVYNHNFFVINQHAVGEGVEIEFSKNISESVIKNRHFIEVDGNKIVWKENFGQHDHINSRSLSGYKDGLSPLACTIIDHRSGAGFTIEGNHAISELALWCYYKSICPEPFINIEVEPGETFEWTYNYTFFQKKER